MNSYMSIQVRVITAQALAQLKAVQAELRRLDSELVKGGAAAGAFGSGIGRASGGLTKFGSQLQWTGRQLQFNFSVPLLLAGAAATKFALDNEQGMTRVKKVYGDASMSAKTFNTETKLLGQAFVELSNHYGVQQKEVLDIASAWASAGASGIALAKGVETTLRTMVLGELDSVSATKALISIQAQYGLSSKQLSDSMAMLNTIENETTVTTADLVVGLAKSAGVARGAGIDIRHLSAMMASLVPAAGSATEAGNALKTIISRMLAPTADAAKYLNAMGLNINTVGWQSKNGTQRLEAFAQSFGKLADSQKAEVSAALGSRFQINKLSILMEDIEKKFNKATVGSSRYAKALDVSKDANKNLITAQKELDTVLNSSPQRLKMIWVSLQNGLANAVQPLIPYLLYAATALKRMFDAFTNLPGPVKKFIVTMLLGLALFGPLLKYIGSTIVLLGELKWFFLGTAKAAVMATGAMLRFALFPFTAVAKGFGAISAAMWRAFGPAITVIWGITVATLQIMARSLWVGMRGIFAVGMVALEPILVGVGAVIQLLWGNLLNAMRAILLSGMTGLSAIFRAAMAAFPGIILAGTAGLGVAWRAVLGAVQGVILAGVTVLGVAWRTVMTAVILVTQNTIPAIAAAWRMVITAVQAVVLGSVTALGVAWRFVLGASQAVIISGASILGVAWRAVMNIAAAVVITGGTAIIDAWRRLIIMVKGVIAAGEVVIMYAWRWLMAAVATAVTMGQTAIYTAWVKITAGIKFIVSSLPAFFTGLMGAIRTVMGAGAVLAGNAFKAGFLFSMSSIRAFFPAILGMFRTLAIGIQTALTGPIGWAIAAVIILLVAFRKQIAQAINNAINYFKHLPAGIISAFAPLANVWNSIVSTASRAFYALPESVQGAMMAVVRVVAAAAHQVYELFSYINPFAHHSPSLVENVTNGVAEVNKQFTKLSEVSGVIKKVYVDIKAFGEATANFAHSLNAAQRAQDRIALGKVAPGALNEFDALVSDVTKLTVQLERMTPIIKAQELVVNEWKTKLDAANDALDIQKNKLSDLQDVASKATENLNASKQKLEDFANAPIQGMKDMNDAIFENDMAQKKLRLEMMKMGDGQGIDKAKDKLSKLAGEIELISGEQASLRAGGAGSEITSVYDDQIKGLEKQQTATKKTIGDFNNLSDALDELSRKGEQLDLEKSLKFDPLLKKIDETAHAIKELPFDEIMTGIDGAAVEVEKYSQQVDAANDAVKRQQDVVDAATKARDGIAKKYDNENTKLQHMKDLYDKVKGAIDDANQSLNDMNTATAKALQQAEAAAKGKKLTGAKANFADVGGKGKIGREGTDAQNQLDLEQLVKDQAQGAADLLGKFDMFGGIKKKWGQFKDWLGKFAGPMWKVVTDAATAIFGGIDWAAPFRSIDFSFLSKIWQTILDIFNSGRKVVSAVWRLFKNDILGYFAAIWKSLSKGMNKLGPSITQFKQLLGPMAEAFGHLWHSIKPVIAIIGIALLGALKIVSAIIKETAGPTIDMLIGILKALLDMTFNFVKLFVALINGDWKGAWEAVMGFAYATADALKSLFGGLFKILIGIISGGIKGVVGFFQWLYDVLVGHSIVPDLINAIVSWFTRLPEMLYGILQAMVTGIINIIKSLWSGWTNLNVSLFQGVYNFFAGVPGKVAGALFGVIGKVRDIAGSAWSAYKTKSMEMWGGIANWLTARADSTYSAAIGIKDKLGSVAHQSFTAFKDRAASVWAGFLLWLKGLPNSILSGLSNIGSILVDAGKAVMQGFIDGIKGGWDSLKDTLKKTSNLVPDVIKEMLGIHSPAKVTDELGQNSIQGYANGVAKKSGEVKAEVAKVSNNILELATAAGQADLASHGMAAGLTELKGAAVTSNSRIKDLEDTVTGLWGKQKSAAQASMDYKSSIDSVSEALKLNKSSWSQNTDKGRDNWRAVMDNISAAQSLRDSNIKSGQSIDEANGKYQEQITKLEGVLTKAGAGKTALFDYAEQAKKIPTEVYTQINTPGLQDARTTIADYDKKISGIQKYLTTNISVDAKKTAETNLRNLIALRDELTRNAAVKINIQNVQQKVSNQLDRNHPQGLAGGGPVGLIAGPGSGTSDSIPAMLSNGEWVTPAKQATKYRSLLIAIQNDTVKAMATGGGADTAVKAIDSTFSVEYSMAVKNFFEITMPDYWKGLILQSLDTWQQIRKTFSDKFVFFVDQFFGDTIPAAWKLLIAQAILTWQAIRASFTTYLQNPVTAFFTNTIKSQWASMIVSAALMWTTIKASFTSMLGNPLVGFFKDTIPQAIRGAFAGIGKVFEGAFSGASGAALIAVNKVIGAVNRGIDAMNMVIPEAKFDIKRVAPIALAGGGEVRGPGTGTSDSILARLSNKEWVTPAEQAQKYKPILQAIQMDKLPAFKDGGEVNSSTGGHAVGGRSGLIAFGRWLTSKGFDVTEGPDPFGPIHHVHKPGSLHYSGNAIDVNHGAGTSAAEQRAIDGIVGYAKDYGLRTLWRIAGHFNHAHFDTGKGGDMTGGSDFINQMVDNIGNGKKSIDQVVAQQSPAIQSTGDYVGQIGSGALKQVGDYLKSNADQMWSNFTSTGEPDSGGGSVMGSSEVARIAEATARSMGATDKQLLALIETGLVESGMRNLSFGDRDSVGFLQQRPSQGWGSVKECMDVAHATKMFINKAKRVDGSGLSSGELAQKVQVSAYPDRYQKRHADAMAILNSTAPAIPSNVFDQGGWLQSGSAGFNMSGKPELVLDPKQSELFAQLFGPRGPFSGDGGSAMTTGVKTPAMSRLSTAAAQSAARVDRASTASTTTVTYQGDTNHTELHFHGNLEFPNVKTSSDATGFVRQLGILSGGQ